MVWLLLRGEWDERTALSIKTDDDLYIQLFSELLNNDDTGVVFFKSNKKRKIRYNDKITIYSDYEKNADNRYAVFSSANIVMSRGGFQWQVDVLNSLPDKTIKIRYGAGRRFLPENEQYHLVLVDTEKQKEQVEAVYPNINTAIFLKPAARQFQPDNAVKKEYDVCYIANSQQARWKGLEWVYATAPKDLKILHLGYPPKQKGPQNITNKRINRIDMPGMINKCKVGIVPYWNGIDSCPRALIEMISCGLPVAMSNDTNIDLQSYDRYGTIIPLAKDEFWLGVQRMAIRYEWFFPYNIEKLDINVAAKSLKQQLWG